MRESGLLAEKGGTDDSAFNSSQGNVIGKHLLFAAIFDISIQIPDLMMSCSICVGGGQFLENVRKKVA